MGPAPALWAAMALFGPRLLYPVDAPPNVTATVGTYRIGHHHAGLDLATGDREGVRALAAMDGQIVRIARSHIGYGRSVFIRHAGGLVTVYAHLERFSPALEAIAHEEEQRVRAYAFERWLPTPLPVKRGDVLGMVGTSGTDLIHLHFEVRVENVPVNPLTHGLELPDTQPPVVSRLRFVPRDASAQIDGRHATFDVVFGAEEPPAVRLSGPIAVLALVGDRIDGSERVLEPNRLELALDDAPVHLVDYDRVSYGQKNATELDYQAERVPGVLGRFHRMYRLDTDEPALIVWPKVGSSTPADPGRLPPGRHVARISATDAVGHRVSRTVPLDIVPFEAPCAPHAEPALSAEPERPFAGASFTESTLVLPLPDACAEGFRWSATLDAGPLTRPHRFTRTAEGPALAIDLDASLGGRVRVVTSSGGQPPQAQVFEALSVRNGATLGGGAAPFSLHVGAKSVFAPYLTAVAEAPNPATAELVPVGPLFVFQQTWAPTRGPSTVRLSRPPEVPTRGLGLYYRDGDRTWRVGGRVTRTPPGVSGSIVHVGGLGLMRDDTPPAVGEAEWVDHPAGARLTISVKDAGAGVTTEGMKLELDGREVYPEFFHAYGRLSYRSFVALSAGLHQVVVSVRDGEGNKTRRKLSFTVPPSRRGK